MKKTLLSLAITTASFCNVFSQGSGCPDITISSSYGVGNTAITLPCDSSCVRLNASVFDILATTSYTVSQLPWTGMPYTATVGVNLSIDDRWSGVINIPFNFCFFGNVFNQLVVSSNGAISFNTQYANSFHQWSFPATDQIPVNTAAFRPNSVFGAMHDTDPSKGGSIRYGVQGSFPCRAFVFSFDNVRHYDCSSRRTYQQIVIYEGTNVIDVYIQDKPGGCSWNGGRAAIGIQNASGTVGYAPPGRNTGNWSTSNEAWRFSPSGAPAYQLTWYEGDITNPPIGTGMSVDACPSVQNSRFSALLTYTNCANENIQFWRGVDVTLGGPGIPNFTTNSPVCEGQTLTFNGPTVAGASYFWSGPGGWTSNVEDPTRPTATAAMSGTYNLYVIVAGCTSSVATQNVLVVSGTSTPTFTTNSPICEGETLLLNGTTYAGATYVWGGPNGFTSALEDPSIPNATPSEAGNYTLYIVVGTCTSGTQTIPVVVNPAPAAPTFTVNTPVCTGEEVIFSTPSVPGATYSWTGPSAWTSSAQNPSIPNANTGLVGEYGLSVIVNGCPSPVTTDSVYVDGPDIPAVSTNSPVCTGDVLNLTTDTIAGATYHWFGPNGFTSTQQSPSLPNANAAMTGTYGLYIELNGCTSDTSYISAYVNPLLSPPINVSQPVCEGDTLTLSTPLDSLTTYYWSGPNAFVDSSGAVITFPNATSALNGIYSLYKVSLGCTTTTATANVTVHPIPATPTPTSNSPVCLNGILQLTGPAGSNTSYLWTGPNGFTSSQQSPVISPLSSQGAGAYTLVISENGCASAPGSHSVTVLPLPDASFTNNDCVGDTVMFQSTTNFSGTYNQAWSFGDGQTSLSDDPTHVYSSPGKYTVTLVAISTIGNCTDTISREITVSTPPEIIITSGVECFQNISFSASINAQGETIANVLWDLDDGTTSTDTSFVHEYENAGQYNVVLTVTNSEGCITSTTETVDVQPAPTLSSIIIPNIITANGDQVNDELALDNQFATCLEYEMFIFNRWGNLVYKQTKDNDPFKGLSASGKKLTAGVYFYTIRSGNINKNGTITVVYQ